MKYLLTRYLTPTRDGTKVIIAVALLTVWTVLVTYFFDNYRLQSPIVIDLRSPVRERYISPVSVGVTATPISNDEDQKGVTPTITPTPNESALAHPEILEKVYTLESSGGKNDGCRDEGKYNGFGYGQNKYVWNCFDSLEEVQQKVDAWFSKHLADKTLAQALCYYNTGHVIDTCEYYELYMSL